MKQESVWDPELLLRVERMEQYLDEVTTALAADGDAARADVSLREKLRALAEYQESGLWLRDYEADERGELPRDLKRGVLAQDTLHDLLCDWKTEQAGAEEPFCGEFLP